ncbi:hypothetical protein N7466_003090 [Penicillium verhagenii]|uniref:uncharacterized protein n=1 Tax=Penicillium verhagenii TaxID=1562060 RepID=UPI002545346A|nr:uncharacterized protein N7466_003090 [Penicillium verhagenii]KAJ5936640.1 hypothetical protein N7466_003090 [Penicillium verhagenii]
MSDSQTPHWKPIVLKKRAAQKALIPTEWQLPASIQSDPPLSTLDAIRSCGILSPEELAWTDTTDIQDLVSAIASRRVTSLQLTTAFCKRAAIAQQLTKCLTEICFERALARARELDEYLLNTGEVVGPLHGIPVSIKDRFEIEGLDTTVGWIGLVNKPAKSSCDIVRLLESMGAIMYVKTNIPQSLMMADSYNNVFGQSTNAFNHNLISGGSSGGEGALIGCGGSILGIGTDIGGSIRVPSALQGLYSIFPTTGRVPWDCSFLHQHYLVPPVAGPMASSLATTEYFMQSLLASNPWDLDPSAIPIPWRTELATPPTNRKLRIGFVVDDGVVKPQPPVTRAMNETIQTLRAAGHEVIEWDTSLHEPATQLWYKAIRGEGGAHCRELCKLIDEPLIEGMLVGKENETLDIEEREQLEREKYALSTAMLKQWLGAGVDALLMPVIPWVGYRPKTWVKSRQWVGYTGVWNLFNYASVTVPVGKADRELDSVGGGRNLEWEDYIQGRNLNLHDQFNYEQCADLGFANLASVDDIELVHGMPICLQIVGGRFGEEKAIAAAKVVDGLMNPTPFHPYH